MAAATLRPPEAAGIGRGVLLALLAHGLLVLALSYSLNWRSDATPAFEAELTCGSGAFRSTRCRSRPLRPRRSPHS